MQTVQTAGPRLSDRAFFLEELDLSRPELTAVREAAEKEDFAAARHAFAAMLRETLQPDVFFTTLPNGAAVKPEPQCLQRAEDASRHRMESCGFPWDFGDAPVDWFANPTYNGYAEWTWQLSRHYDLLYLAQAWRATGNDRYAYACAELMYSWIRQALCPDDTVTGGETLCWRTIECGIRMGLVWPEILHTFFRHPAFTDDLLTDWCKSVWEHGRRLRLNHRTGNWLIHEMNGLAQIGVLYPFLRQAESWLSYAMEKLEDELRVQVYPDGLQFELSTVYQGVVIDHYSAVLRILRAYGRPVSPQFAEMLEKMLLVYVRLMRPDGKTPDINDGNETVVSDFAAKYLDICPHSAVLRWAASSCAEGAPPQETSYTFAYAGLAAMRTGWGKDDTWLFFDGGEFGTGHQHEDKLQVLFHADGAYTVTEANRYSYDTSPMRDYVLSTRAHNTVRVDGMEQNRGAGYRWHGDMKKQTDMQWTFTPKADTAYAVYNEGYGPHTDRDVTHSRRVLFIKQPAFGLRPFAVIVDRLTASREHTFEVLWHLDSPTLSADGLQLQAGTLHLLVPEAPAETAGLSVARGQQFPEWQGWKCNSTVQKDFRPICTAQYMLRGTSVRWVTVLYPDGGKTCPIAKVEASLQTEDTKLTIYTTDGAAYVLDETVV